MKTPNVNDFKRFIVKNKKNKTYAASFCSNKEFCQGIHNMAVQYQIQNPCSVCTQLIMEKLFRYEETQEQMELEALTIHDEYLS
jgi:hypothetical protein